MLKMAKVFAESKPAKARELARQVIELVPDTPAAKDAAQMLEGLEQGGGAGGVAAVG